MNTEDFRNLVICVLKEHGRDVFESDKGDSEDAFILESHNAERHRWNVESWSLFRCTNRNKPVDLEDVERFHGLIISDNAERGYMIATSGFTEDAMEFVNDKPIEIIDGKGFLALVKKASTSQAYCAECLKISLGIRASLQKLRVGIESLNRIERESSGKWSAPFHLDLMFGEMVKKIKFALKTTPELERRRLETKLHIKIEDIASSVARMTRSFKSFEKIIWEFSKREK